MSDTLIGKDGQNDTLGGRDGNDVLYGGTGNDILWGDAGEDKSVFASALNASTNLTLLKTSFLVRTRSYWITISLLALVQDRLWLAEQRLYLGLIQLQALLNPTILYNSSTGVLSYDADGSGAGAAIAFADLTNNSNVNPTISTTDFIIL